MNHYEIIIYPRVVTVGTKMDAADVAALKVYDGATLVCTGTKDDLPGGSQNDDLAEGRNCRRLDMVGLRGEVKTGW